MSSNSSGRGSGGLGKSAGLECLLQLLDLLHHVHVLALVMLEAAAELLILHAETLHLLLELGDDLAVVTLALLAGQLGRGLHRVVLLLVGGGAVEMEVGCWGAVAVSDCAVAVRRDGRRGDGGVHTAQMLVQVLLAREAFAGVALAGRVRAEV